MKFAVVSCLLAFCAFQVVLTDLLKDCRKPILDFMTKKGKEVQGSIAEYREQQKTQVCQDYFDVQVKTNVETVCFPELDKCVENRDVKYAKQCCVTKTKICKSDVQDIVDTAQGCIEDTLIE